MSQTTADSANVGLTPWQVYARDLPSGQTEEFALDGLDRVGVPVWSVMRRMDEDASARKAGAAGGIGYGPTYDDARTSAWGECAESALGTLAAGDGERPTASYDEMVAEHGSDAVADPLTLALEAGSDYTSSRPLQWLPMTRLRDGARVWVPAEMVGSHDGELPGGPPPGGWIVTPITNGQGAGLSREQALGHALGELLQRDGNGTTFRAMDAGVVIDLDGLTDPAALETLERLRASGIDPIVKLATTQLGIPDVYCVGIARDGLDDDVPIAASACGEAAHPDAQRAVRKALLEYASARARKIFMHGPLDAVRAIAPEGYMDRFVAAYEGGDASGDHGIEEPRAMDAMLAWNKLSAAELVDLLRPTVLSQRSTVAFTDLPSTPVPTPEAGLDLVVSRLAEEGMDVLFSEFTRGDVVTVKAVVPGLEVETMSYKRIGERGVAKLLARGQGQGAELVAVGERPEGAGWARVLLTGAAEERLGGPAWLDRDGVDATVGDLYPLYREPSRHTAALARGER